jgi:hypothetical protein
MPTGVNKMTRLQKLRQAVNPLLLLSIIFIVLVIALSVVNKTAIDSTQLMLFIFLAALGLGATIRKLKRHK